MSFIILLREYHFSQLKCYRALIIFLILLIENINNNKIKGVNFYSHLLDEIEMTKKRGEKKYVTQLIKR